MERPENTTECHRGAELLGSRTYQHTLVGSYERSASDVYGLAVGHESRSL